MNDVCVFNLILSFWSGIYRALTSLRSDLWYNCWMLVDNTTDVIRLWLHPRGSDAAGPADLLTVDGLTEYSFRYDSAEDLHTFFMKTGGGSGMPGSFYLDDIYLEDSAAENLANPAATSLGVPPSGDPAVSGLVRISPCPTVGTAWIVLDSSLSGVRAVRVCDAGGREVVRLAVTPAAGGNQTLWDGRDRQGRRAAAGVYYVLPEGSRPVTAGRLVVIR